ncbi:GNAT family N-acetyltransferase [Dactylosporangium vinaceum]|uniref:GNAT family N-acetyltransferase n=1 Tax=Dactylosporangium vinaceum TaxID=53362 RepID=A0ABV5M1W5_9ACTN|nr:GNAT family N-acetyltransferase [Dactylosporangium vinaceum]UAB99339.1 GNAT family N-acetyltransferase [Dactylosporangium vinaceum]
MTGDERLERPARPDGRSARRGGVRGPAGGPEAALTGGWSRVPSVQPIRTDRLVLREPRVDDAGAVFVFRGDPQVQRYNDEPLRTLQETEAFIEYLLAEAAAGLRRHFALEVGGTVVGLMGLHSWQPRHRRAELGYDIAKEHWGRGYGTEAGRAVLAFGFTAMRLHRIHARTIADNDRSVHLLQSLGFTREGTLRESSLEDDGRFHDSALFGLLRSEWATAG